MTPLVCTLVSEVQMWGGWIGAAFSRWLGSWVLHEQLLTSWILGVTSRECAKGDRTLRKGVPLPSQCLLGTPLRTAPPSNAPFKNPS